MKIYIINYAQWTDADGNVMIPLWRTWDTAFRCLSHAEMEVEQIKQLTAPKERYCFQIECVTLK